MIHCETAIERNCSNKQANSSTSNFTIFREMWRSHHLEFHTYNYIVIVLSWLPFTRNWQQLTINCCAHFGYCLTSVFLWRILYVQMLCVCIQSGCYVYVRIPSVYVHTVNGFSVDTSILCGTELPCGCPKHLLSHAYWVAPSPSHMAHYCTCLPCLCKHSYLSL